MSDKKKSARSTRARVSNLLSDEERAAMKETLKERRRALSGEADGESDVLAKIAEMSEPDRDMAKRLHAVIKASAPTLSPKTWYGMPAYAKDGKVVCFFQSGQKFKSRYATFGFQDAANLDDGDIWPTSFALRRLTAAVEEKIGKLVKREGRGGERERRARRVHWLGEPRVWRCVPGSFRTVSQICHAFVEPGRQRRTPQDMTTGAIEYRRTLEQPAGT